MLCCVQCRGGVGACPDTEDSSGTCTNHVTLVGGFSEDGQQCVTFTRNFAAGKTTIFPSSLCTTVYDVMSHVQGMSVICLWIQTMRTNMLCGEWVDWEKLPSDTSSEHKVGNIHMCTHTYKHTHTRTLMCKHTMNCSVAL